MNRDKRSVSEDEMVRQLGSLGVKPGDTVLVHTSFRRVRPVEGGPAGLLGALRTAVGPRGTLVLPSWTDDDDAPFDPEATPAARSLGVTADIFWRMDDVARSDHPFACAAAGRLAETVTSDPLPIPPYTAASPLGRVLEMGGKVLLLGVGHDCSTMIHLAEHRAGVPYGVPKHVTVLEGGRPTRIDYQENDHCCQRFGLVGGWLSDRGLQSEGRVGHARALLAQARDVVNVTTERLRRDPYILLHPPEAECEDCDLARAGVQA